MDHPSNRFPNCACLSVAVASMLPWVQAIYPFACVETHFYLGTLSPSLCRTGSPCLVEDQA